VTLPQSLVNIGDNTFNGCSSLTMLAIPNGVTNIGWYTFANCSAIQSPILPSELRSIGRGTFQSCQSIETVNLPDKVQEVGDNCFENCAVLPRRLALRQVASRLRTVVRTYAVPDERARLWFSRGRVEGWGGCSNFRNCSSRQNAGSEIGM
jgi:hypothetical protein